MLKKTIILSLFYILLLSACGQTGPLYFPPPEQAKQNTQTPPVA